MRSRLNIIVVGEVILMAAFLASPTLAKEPTQVTRGNFVTYAAGLETGYHISGQTRMVRSAAGYTSVTVAIQGLTPNTSYGVNVHDQPCSNEAGSGHYQHEVGGAVDNINEIWQVMTARSNGYGNSKTVNDFVARSEARSVVIHNADNTSLACADLNPIAVSSYTFGTTQIEELAAFYTNETNVQRTLGADAARYTGLAAFYAAADGSATSQPASVDIEALRQHIYSDWVIEAEAVDISILGQPTQGNVTNQPVAVDIEVLRNNYYNALQVAQTDPAAEPVDFDSLLGNNPNYFHPGR